MRERKRGWLLGWIVIAATIVVTGIVVALIAVLFSATPKTPASSRSLLIHGSGRRFAH